MHVSADSVQHHGSLRGRIELGAWLEDVLPNPEYFVNCAQCVDLEFIVGIPAGDENLEVVLVMEVRPFTLLRRLQSYSTAHAEERHDSNDDHCQNPHTPSLYHSFRAAIAFPMNAAASSLKGFLNVDGQLAWLA